MHVRKPIFETLECRRLLTISNPSFESGLGEFPQDAWTLNIQEPAATGVIHKIDTITDRVNAGAGNTHWMMSPTNGSQLAVIGTGGASAVGPQSATLLQAVPVESLEIGSVVSFDWAFAAGQRTDGNDIFRVSLRPDQLESSDLIDEVAVSEDGGSASDWATVDWHITQEMINAADEAILIIAHSQKDNLDKAYKIRLALDNFRIQPPPSNLPDINQDGAVDAKDIDELFGLIEAGDVAFDLNFDSILDVEDIKTFVADHFGSFMGDANLDGRVNATDLNTVGVNWQQDVGSWADGDFNGDGFVDASDLNFLGVNWQAGLPQAASIEARVPRAALHEATLVTSAPTDGVASRALFPRPLKSPIRAFQLHESRARRGEATTNQTPPISEDLRQTVAAWVSSP